MTALARSAPGFPLKRAILAVLAALSLASCGINSVPTAEENVNAKWGDLQADYQRRADLIPNLVATVKGYAQQEKSVLVQVTQARADATAVHLSAADLSDPAKKTKSASSHRERPICIAAAKSSGSGHLQRPTALARE